MRSRLGSPTVALTALLLLATALFGAASASAATVVNGSFETGTLEGWHLYQSNEKVAWEVEEEMEGLLPAPLDGKYLAASIQEAPGTTILYQDIALEPAATHALQMTLVYGSEVPIAIPQSQSLFVGATAPVNQQFRVDVMKPTAPIESLAPGDVLGTVFATSESENEEGEASSPEMEPKRFSFDLTPFAGQTVRLRLAVAVTNGPLFAGVDRVSITSTPIPAPPAPPASAPPAPPSNRIQKGRLTLDRRKGTAKLAITVPGAGTLTVMDASTKIAIASMTSSGTNGAKGGHKPRLIRAATLHPTAAGTIELPIRPTASGRRRLGKTGRLPVRARLTFTPTSGTAATQVYRATLRRTFSSRR